MAVEAGKVCLLQDLVGTLYCTQACKFYADEDKKASGEAVFNDINSICGWLVGQPKYESMIAGFNEMRMDASRMLIGLATNALMDVNAHRLSERMERRVIELDAESGSPLPAEVVYIASRNYCFKYFKKFCKVSGKPVGFPPGRRYIGCNGCGAEVKTTWCSGCRVYRYCSSECQLAHFPTHRATCRAIHAHLNPPDGASYRYFTE